MANNIVTISVATVTAPAPLTLQGSGAFVTQGGTNTAANTLTLVSDEAELAAILRAPLAITSITWSTSVATVTTAAPHGLPNGQVIPVTISGAVPVAYNGSVDATVTGASTFTYPLTPDPGTSPASTPGFWTTQAAAELESMGNTFFGQGDAVSVYVLELGPDEASDGVADLDAWITANPGVLYSYLVPRAWADEADYVTLVGEFTADTAKTYFFTTMELGNYADFANTKSVFGMIEAPTAPATEFSLASAFYTTLANSPSANSKVAPTAFRFLYGVTPYPEAGNAATLAALKAAGVNVVGTGAEGQLSNRVLFWGTVMGTDRRDFTYWYGVDWAQINLDADLANEIINGSNNPLAPLYYDQDGIDRLQARAQDTLNRGISYGLILSPATVDAEPFVTYVAENPSDFASGTYNGLSATITANRGFKSLTFNLVVTDFPTA